MFCSVPLKSVFILTIHFVPVGCAASKLFQQIKDFVTKAARQSCTWIVHIFGLFCFVAGMFPLSSSDQLGYIPGERLHWAEMQRDTIIHDRRHLIRTLVEGVFPFDDRGFWTHDLQACGGWAAFHLVAVELNVLSHVDGVLHSITARATYLFSRGRRLLLHNRIAHLFSCGNVFYSITATDAYLFSLEDVFRSITERAAYLFSCGRCLPLHNRKLHICFHVEEVFHSITARAAYLFSCGRGLPLYNDRHWRHNLQACRRCLPFYDGWKWMHNWQTWGGGFFHGMLAGIECVIGMQVPDLQSDHDSWYCSTLHLQQCGKCFVSHNAIANNASKNSSTADLGKVRASTFSEPIGNTPL